MQKSFRIKSKSQAKVRRKFYEKIKNNKSQDQWNIFLNKELEIQVIINELSKAEFDHTNKNKFKYVARSILMKKKEIIYKLQQQEFTMALSILKELVCKMSDYQQKKIKMMVLLLQCKIKMDKTVNSISEEEIIRWLKVEINEYGHQYDSYSIKITILTILSLLLIHFHGILMITDEKTMVFKTIELKKKKVLEINQIQEGSFECLVYLLSQIYKIIYLLKKDQQLILSYYNQLSAYAQTFISNSNYKFTLDLKEIEKILQNMKPLLNDLNIYEDSQIRKEFAFSNLKDQILNQQEQLGTKKMPTYTSKQKLQRTSSIKVIRVSNLLKVKTIIIPNNNNKKLTLNYKSQAIFRNSNLIERITEGIQFLADFERQEKVIDFLKIHKEQLLLINLKMNLRNSCSTLDIEISIKRNECQSQIYILKGIQVMTHQYTFKKISRFIEKLFLFLFQNDGYLPQLNHIEMAQEYIPDKLATDDILISIIRIKALIKHYIKTKMAYNSLIPNKIAFPNFSLEQIKHKFQSQLKTNHKESLMVRKRQGKIIRQHVVELKNNELNLKILYRIEHEKVNEYIFFNINFIYQLKAITIYLFSNHQEIPEILLLAKKLQKITYKKDRDINKKLRFHIMSMIQKQRSKNEKVIQINNSFNVQLQIMLNSSHNSSQVVHLSLFKDYRITRKEKIRERKHFEMMKINHRYLLFSKHLYESYSIYTNFNSKITLPNNWKDLGWSITTAKIRMYNGIKIMKRTHNADLLIITSFKSEEIIFQYKQIELKIISHKVVRKQKGYCLLLQYMTPHQQYLYEIIVNPLTRFFCLSESRKQPLVFFNQKQYNSNDKEFKYYHLGRQKVSQANHYYETIIKNHCQ